VSSDMTSITGQAIVFLFKFILTKC
jgi:hypothetical protein